MKKLILLILLVFLSVLGYSQADVIARDVDVRRNLSVDGYSTFKDSITATNGAYFNVDLGIGFSGSTMMGQTYGGINLITWWQNPANLFIGRWGEVPDPMIKNTVIGINALYKTDIHTDNIVIGESHGVSYDSLNDNTFDSNIGIGMSAFNSLHDGNSSIKCNTLVGNFSFGNCKTVRANIAIGQALYHDVEGLDPIELDSMLMIGFGDDGLPLQDTSTILFTGFLGQIDPWIRVNGDFKVDNNAYINDSVGIGTKAPKERLDVNGSIKINGYIENDFPNFNYLKQHDSTILYMSPANVILGRNFPALFNQYNTLIGTQIGNYSQLSVNNTISGSMLLLTKGDSTANNFDYNTISGLASWNAHYGGKQISYNVGMGFWNATKTGDAKYNVLIGNKIYKDSIFERDSIFMLHNGMAVGLPSNALLYGEFDGYNMDNQNLTVNGDLFANGKFTIGHKSSENESDLAFEKKILNIYSTDPSKTGEIEIDTSSNISSSGWFRTSHQIQLKFNDYNLLRGTTAHLKLGVGDVTSINNYSTIIGSGTGKGSIFGFNNTIVGSASASSAIVGSDNDFSDCNFFGSYNASQDTAKEYHYVNIFGATNLGMVDTATSVMVIGNYVYNVTSDDIHLNFDSLTIIGMPRAGYPFIDTTNIMLYARDFTVNPYVVFNYDLRTNSMFRVGDSTHRPLEFGDEWKDDVWKMFYNGTTADTLNKAGTGSGATILSQLTDVASAAQTPHFVLMTDGGNYYGRLLYVADLSDSLTTWQDTIAASGVGIATAYDLTQVSVSGDMLVATYDQASVLEQLVGETATQTLTNKTLTTPVINSPTGIVKGDVGLGLVENVALSTWAGTINIINFNKTGNWTGTFDGQQGTWYQSRANHTGPMTADLDFDGNNIDNGGVIFLKEQVDADTDVSGSGQIWVNTATPNELYFTDDIGADERIVLEGDSAFLYATKYDLDTLLGNGIDIEQDSLTLNDGWYFKGGLYADLEQGTTSSPDSMVLWNGSTKKFSAISLDSVSTVIGATAWDDIGDPDNNGLTTIEFDNVSENTLFTSIYDEVGSFFKILNTDPTIGNNVYLLELAYDDDERSGADFIKCVDDADGSPTVVFTVKYDGEVTTESSVLAGGAVTAGTSFIINSANVNETELEIIDGATVTTAELNIMDGSETDQSTVTLLGTDGVVISDGDVMTQALVSDFLDYITGETDWIDDTHIKFGTDVNEVNPLDFEAQNLGDVLITGGKWKVPDTLTYNWGVMDTVIVQALPGWRVPFDITLIDVSAYTDVNTTTFNIEERGSSTPNTTGTDALTGALAAHSNGARSSTFSNAGFVKDSWIVPDISATDDVAIFSITIRYIKAW